MRDFAFMMNGDVNPERWNAIIDALLLPLLKPEKPKTNGRPVFPDLDISHLDAFEKTEDDTPSPDNPEND